MNNGKYNFASMKGKTDKPVAAPTEKLPYGWNRRELYDGKELRPFEGRPAGCHGCAQAAQSRDRLMTAVQLEALLHYYYKVNRFGEPNPSRSEKDAEDWALNNNLISNDGVGNISLTPRGQFLVDYLLNTPLPVAIEAFEVNRE